MTTEKQRTEAIISARELMHTIVSLAPQRPSVLDIDLDQEPPEIVDIEMMEIPVSIARRIELLLRHYPWDYHIRYLAQECQDILVHPDKAKGRY